MKRYDDVQLGLASVSSRCNDQQHNCIVQLTDNVSVLFPLLLLQQMQSCGVGSRKSKGVGEETGVVMASPTAACLHEFHVLVGAAKNTFNHVSSERMNGSSNVRGSTSDTTLL